MPIRIFFGTTLAFGFGAILFIDFVTTSNVATTLGLAGVTVLGLFEFYRMQENRRLPSHRTAGMLGGALLVGAHWFRHACERQDLRLPMDPVLAVLMAVLLLLGLWTLLQPRNRDGLTRLAVTSTGLLYVWLPLSFLFEIRNAPGLTAQAGIWAVMHLLATAKIGDVGAFFTGRFLGRHKLAPAISPGKTLEGSAGGLVASIALSVGLCVAIPSLADLYGPAGGAVFGVVVGCIAQAGDLFESLLKRQAGVKDSGALIPEFGGLLDLVDSLLFAGPVAFLFLVCFR